VDRNGLASELEVMHKAAENCHIQIPLEVVSFIDEGRNPDEYTRNLLNSCVQRNQVSRGKVDAFKVRLIQQSFLVLFSGHGRA
jgi:mediator of RNA polymerase II transcription subunit 10